MLLILVLKDRKLHILTLHPEGEYNELPFPSYKYEDLRKTSFSDNLKILPSKSDI